MLIISAIKPKNSNNFSSGKTSIVFNLGKIVNKEKKLKILLIDNSNDKDLFTFAGIRREIKENKIYKIKEDLDIIHMNKIDILEIKNMNYDLVLIDDDKQEENISDISDLILYILTENCYLEEDIKKDNIIYIHNKCKEENTTNSLNYVYKIHNYKEEVICNLFDMININNNYKKELSKLSEIIFAKCNYKKNNIIEVNFSRK